MMKPTAEQIAKLPKWAQEHIANIERERDVSIRALNKSIDTTTESPFYYETFECTGEEDKGPSMKRYYYQAHNMTVVHLGVEATIYLRDRGINISYSSPDTVGLRKEIAIMPDCHQSITLVPQDLMR